MLYILSEEIKWKIENERGILKLGHKDDQIKMKNMTWQEFEKRKEDLVIIPIGATEQHGPHLPLCVDSVLAEEFSLQIAQKVHGIVAPAIVYGYKSKPFSGGGPLFPGTIDLNGNTLQKLIQDIIDELVRDGFHKILLFSAHFENEPFLVEAMDLCSKIYKDKVKLLLMNWWDPISNELINQIFDKVPFPGWALEHAAVTETSLMMYFAPELVREEKIKDKENIIPEFCYQYPVDKNSIPSDGVLATAFSSTKEKGKMIAENVVKNIVEYLETVFH